MNLNTQIEEILEQKPDKKKLASQLGFFSKPMRIGDNKGNEYVVKFYRPLKNEKKCQEIISHHDAYVKMMEDIGIKIPETVILLKKKKGKNQLVIIQKAFLETELIRGQLETANEPYLIDTLRLVLDDTLRFWKNKPAGVDIGFHPTLRNYALKDQQLYYFDTFPPMLMKKEVLNKLIILMAPVKLNIRALVPQKAINRVSDEYYEVDKMVTGIIGSCCRLRPDLNDSILKFGREYIMANTILQPNDRAKILENIERPPQLPGIWITFRKLFGKTGKPNVR